MTDTLPNLSLKTHWKNLLVWLGSHGMKVGAGDLCVECKARPGAGNGLFAAKTCSPSMVLFTVPARVLVNIKTLASHYPSRPSLTATQLISLHLLLHRPEEGGSSSDPLFGPYISILPQEFDSHPLTWLVKREMCMSDPVETELLETLTPSVKNSLQKVGERFQKDWQRTREFIDGHPEIINKLEHPGRVIKPVEAPYTALTMEFLWSWLNVNTRCIYWRLKPSRADPDNLTLCPIVDFANHTAISPHMFPRSTDAEIWDTAPQSKLGHDMTLLSSHSAVIQKGEEMYLNYGAHSNRVLFVEYGFVNDLPGEGPSDKFGGEVDVQDIIEEMFRNRGIVGDWMKGILEEEGYWEDWTMHSFPTPASPSFRLTTALRLYHVLPISLSTVPSLQENVLQPWRDTLAGKREYISEENENSWKGTLAEICNLLIMRAESRMGDILMRPVDEHDRTWDIKMWRDIESLWNEENYVAKAVAQSIRNGEQLY